MSMTELGDAKYVSLTTFRRSGEGVSTPVWVARDGDRLVVMTEDGTGKVKRIRNDARVEVRPSDMRGRVDAAAVAQPGTAQILTGADSERMIALIGRKYGWQFRAFELLGRLRRGKGQRVVVRISAA